VLFFWVSPRRSQQCGGHCGKLGLIDGAVVSLNISVTISGGDKIEKTWMQQRENGGSDAAESSKRGGGDDGGGRSGSDRSSSGG